MGSDESEGTGWVAYDQSFQEDAHQLLAWGYQDARRLIAPDREETEITGFIAEAIQARLSSPGIDKDFDRYSLRRTILFRAKDEPGNAGCELTSSSKVTIGHVTDRVPGISSKRKGFANLAIPSATMSAKKELFASFKEGMLRIAPK